MAKGSAQPLRHRGARPARGRANVVTIAVKRLPEGVWLATSEDLPGLTVETETRDEAIDEARVVALDLMEEMGRTPDRKGQAFAFVFQD